MRLCRTRRFNIGEAAFFKVSKPLKKTEKPSTNGAGPYKILYIKCGKALIERVYLTERISLDRLGCDSKTAKPVLDERYATSADTATEKNTGRLWVFSNLSDQCIFRTVQTEFRVTCYGRYDPT